MITHACDTYLFACLSLHPVCHSPYIALQDALIRSLLEMVCVYYRKQAGIEEEEEAEVRLCVGVFVVPRLTGISALAVGTSQGAV